MPVPTAHLIPTIFTRTWPTSHRKHHPHRTKMLRNSLAKQKPNFRELNPGKQQSQCYCPTMPALIHRHSSLFDGTRRIVSLTDGCLFVTGAGHRTLGECPSLRVRAMRTHSIGSLWQPENRAVEKQGESFPVLDTTMSRDHKATR